MPFSRLVPAAALLLAALAGVLACSGGPAGDGDAGSTSGSTSSTSGSSGTTSGSSSGSNQISDTGFSRDCAVDDDCIPVYFGEACVMCAGSNASIAKSGETAYQAAFNKARAGCPASPPGLCAAGYSVTKCTGKKCELIPCGMTTPPADPHTCADGGS